MGYLPIKLEVHAALESAFWFIRSVTPEALPSLAAMLHPVERARWIQAVNTFQMLMMILALSQCEVVAFCYLECTRYNRRPKIPKVFWGACPRTPYLVHFACNVTIALCMPYH